MNRPPADSLLEPSLAHHRARPEPRRLPWMLDGQLIVGALGGPLAAAVVGVLNGHRLGLPVRALAAIGAVGVAGVVVAAAAYAAVANGDGDRSARLVIALTGAATFVVTRRLQKDANRRWAAGRAHGDAYGSLFFPGFLIVVGAGLATAFLLTAVVPPELP